MSWASRFALRQYVKGSLWILPLIGLVVGVLVGDVAARTDGFADLPGEERYSSGTAEAVLTAIVGSTVALTGFVVTVSVLVVQMATGTFSARYMRLWYRDIVLKTELALLVGTFMYSYTLLRHVEADSVPDFGVTLAGVLMAAGLLGFLVFLDRFVHRLRPVAVADLVAAAGREAIAASGRAGARFPEPHTDGAGPHESGSVRVVSCPSPGAIQAVDVAGLVRFAQANDAVVVLRHAVGDFVPTGAALLEVRGGGAEPGATDGELAGMVARAKERTIEQDPAFALRIMVDIAVKALSRAINDPTSATQVIDHLEDLLIAIGRTPGLDGLSAYADARGVRRVLVPAQRWEDFLALAVTEIRLYGGTSIQVVRRLRAMLETLREAVLPENVVAVDEELARLDATVDAAFGGSADIERARLADRQGVGGPAAMGARAALR